MESSNDAELVVTQVHRCIKAPTASREYRSHTVLHCTVLCGQPGHRCDEMNEI